MKTWTLLYLAALAVACARPESDTRGARRVIGEQDEASTRFDRAQSAAFFAGISEFDDEGLNRVPYAVDDAVDLAWTFSLERNVALVLPENIVLALSGQPVKEESRERLKKLTAAGARTTAASRDEILTRLEAQAKKTGRDGILIAGFASHGFTIDGTPYVLAATSSFGNRRSSLSSATIFDAAALARRSLIFIDACRERVSDGVRGAARPAVPTALLQRMPGVNGQVVFYAGTYAYDDHRKKNGVFTNAILDCLRCDMLRDARGVVTVGTLATSVEKRVLKWINDYRDPSVGKAIQVSMDVDAGTMPLAVCSRPPQPHRARSDGSTAIALDEHDDELWRRDLPRRLLHAEAADLDGDALSEVIAGAADGTIATFDADGHPGWTAMVPSLRTLITADLFRKKRRQVVVLAGMRLTVFDYDGTRMSAYLHSRELQNVVVDRMTSRHAPRIVVTDAAGNVFMLDPKKVGTRRPLWQGTMRPPSPIRGVEITDHDNDGRRDITIRTERGRVVLAFDGHTLQSDGAQFFSLH